MDPNKAVDRAGSLGIKREQIVELIRDPEEFVDSCLEGRIEAKFRADPRSGNEPAERPPNPTG